MSSRRATRSSTTRRSSPAADNGDDNNSMDDARSSSLRSSNSTSNITASAEQQAPRTMVVDHPYLTATYSSEQRRRRPPILTLSNIRLAERRVIRDLKARSGWRFYPRGPNRCYTQIKANNSSSNGSSRSNHNDDDDETENGEDAADAAVDHNPSSSPDDVSSSTAPHDPPPEAALQVGRVNSLSLNDLTVYALLEVLDVYLHNNRRWRANVPRPAVPPTPPPWNMPSDIAVLDQLRTMELFQCTGALPESMNYLLQLRSIKLRSCHGLQMQSLRSLSQLRELEITDSEGVVPSTFAHLPQLERVKLYRIASSDADTRTIGRDWIQDLKEHDHFSWNDSLKDLCFCSAGLENDDLATLLVDTLPHKFPSLRAVFIISNAEITSFQPILTRWSERYQQDSSSSVAATPARFVPPPLRVLSLTGTNISKTVSEMQHIEQFLKLFTEIGLFMMVVLPHTLRADVVQSVHRINYQLTLNRAGGPTLLSCSNDTDNLMAVKQEGSPTESSPPAQRHPQQRRPLPLSMWPVVLERAMDLEYVPCYELSEDANSNATGNTRPWTDGRGEAVMQRVDRVVARARMLFQDRANQNNDGNNNNNNDNNNADGNANGVNIPFFNNNNNDNNADIIPAPNNAEDDVPVEENWMESPREFSDRSRYDAVFHLLRHGPMLLASGHHEPRCRRTRSFVARKCKRIKLF